jgi:hypothetical protein
MLPLGHFLAHDLPLFPASGAPSGVFYQFPAGELKEGKGRTMERVRRTDLDDILAYSGGPCVSLFLPLHPAGRDGMEDAVRLRNLTGDAEEQLVARGMRRPDAVALLEPARALPDDNLAWQHRDRAAAIFLAPQFFRAVKFHRDLEPSLHVDDHFHLRPILPLIDDEQRFFVLALSQDSVCLLEGDADGLHEVSVRGLPHDLAAALNTGGRGEAPAPTAASGQPQVVLEGEHGNSRAAQDDLQLFLRRVAAAVDKHLEGDRAPLVLATIADYVPLWREASRYAHRVEDFVAGNARDLTSPQLHAKAWRIAEPLLRHRREWLHDRLLNATGAGKATFGLPDVVPAAIGGRIEALFIDCAQPRWGRYSAGDHTARVHDQPQPGDEDLVELAATETLRHRGEVYAANLGSGRTAEALLRW